MVLATRGRKSRIRRLADSQELDTGILLVIMFNCVIMAFPPNKLKNATSPTDFFCLADFILNFIFFCEFAIKFYAYGFNYFKDTWNQLDFVVVMQGTLSMATDCPYVFGRSSGSGFADISALRMMRVLRPLKSLRKFPEMRLLVGSLFGSFHLLLAILVLIAMAVFCFAVVATLYFGDALDYRCVPDPYYDPGRGTFHAFVPYSNLNEANTSRWPDADLSNGQYWDSAPNFRAYQQLLEERDDDKKARNRFLVSSYWRSLTGVYRDYRKDLVPHYTEFPYFSSFCGECDTCHKCQGCYSDDPKDGCDKTISGDFFRRYGDPALLNRTFLGARTDAGPMPGMPIDYVHPKTPQPSFMPSMGTLSPTGLYSARPTTSAPSMSPVVEPTSMPSAYRFVPNRPGGSVTRITEVCVDLKLSSSESIGSDGLLVQPKVSLGGFFTQIINAKLNLGFKNIEENKSPKPMPPENYAIKLKRDVANCEADLDTANKVFEPYWRIKDHTYREANCSHAFKGTVYPESFYELCAGTYKEGWADFYARDLVILDRISEHKCKAKDGLSSKTGSSRHGFMGQKYPRHKQLVWYMRFDGTLWSLLTIFDVMNMENWNDAMWAVQKAVGKYTWPFFYAVVGFVNICLLNLFPAVMSFNLRKAIREEENRIAYAAKAALLGDEVLSMTQFEEHMIDILAAEEEDVVAIRNYVDGHGSATLNLVQADTSDPLDSLPGVPQGQFFDILRQIVRPEMGKFSIFIYGCILGNLLCMAITPLHAESTNGRIKPAHVVKTLYAANMFFTWVFILECIIKVTALGLAGYFYDGYNCFDFVLVLFSCLDVMAELALSAGASGSVIFSGGFFNMLRIVRMCRLLRVLRLLSISKIHRKKSMAASQLDFTRLMGIMASASIWVANVLGLLFLVVYMGAIVSMQFFGGEVYALNDFSGRWSKRGRLNFDTFGMSFITNFVVITGDGWNEVMYSTMHACGGISAVYFVLILVIARYAILSMLIAIIFDQVERDSILVIKQAAQTAMVAVFKFERGMLHGLLRFFFVKWFAASRSAFDDAVAEEAKGGISLAAQPEPPLTRWQRFMLNEKTYMLFPPDQQPRRFISWLSTSQLFENVMFLTIMVSVFVLALYYQYRNTHMHSSDPDRNVMEFIVGCSGFTGQPSFCGPHLELLYYIQRVCMWVFVSEFLILTIAHGLFEYLSSWMNCLDAVVTSLSVLSGVFGVSAVLPFMIFRMTRIIRPLKKFVQSSPAIMSILTALENSSRGLFAVITFGFFVWTTIAVVGMQLYQGKLNYCTAAAYPKGMLLKVFGPDKINHMGNALDSWPYKQLDYPVVANSTYDDGLPYHGWPLGRTIWGDNATNSLGCKVKYPVTHPRYNRFGEVVNTMDSFKIEKAFYNFDNFWQAIGSAFAMFTFDDWHRLVLQCVNAKTVGQFRNHEAQASVTMPLFFFVFAGCSSFLITFLFVGVIYGTFTYLQLTRGRRKIASLKQAQWSVYESKLACIQPSKEPQEPRSTLTLTKLLFRLFRHPKYRVVYATVLFIDVWLFWILFGSQIPLATHDQQHAALDSRQGDVAQYLHRLRALDLVISFFLITEWFLKMACHGWFVTITRSEERLRLVLLVPVALYFFLESSEGWEKIPLFDMTLVQRGLVALRSTQVFLVVPLFPELTQVYHALTCALGTVFPMVGLMSIVTFAFAVIGMVLFGNSQIRKRDRESGLPLPRVFGNYWPITRVKFSTIPKSMNILFIAATSNNWVATRDAMRSDLPPELYFANRLFWMAYILLVRFLFLNVCTLIYIYKYESTSPVQPWIAMQQVEEFLVAWQHFDQYGVGRIRTKLLSRLLRLLSPPLGLSRDAPQALADRHARRILMAMPLLLDEEHKSNEADLVSRWEEVRKPFTSSQHSEGGKLPRYLEFHDVLKTVHRVVMFPELQALPDDRELQLRREYAQAKLDILRLSVNRFCEPAGRAVDVHGDRVPACVADMSLVQRARPDVFRYRLRQALTLEVYRWQKQIEFGRFDEESFHECALLLKAIKEERLSGLMQLEVLNRLNGKGMLMSLQERRPKLQRHLGFLDGLLSRVEKERSNHVRKAWLPSSMAHEGTLPCAPKSAVLPKERLVSSIAVGGRQGDLIVTCHGGKHVTVWKKRKPPKKSEDDWLKSEAQKAKEKDLEEARDPWAYAPYFKTQQLEEDLGSALCVAMTPDGKRFFSSAGFAIRGWVQAKKVKGVKRPQFRCESIMQGHAKDVTCLKIAHRQLFSTAEDGTIRIWRLRGTDALQSATLSYQEACTSLCLLDTASDPRDTSGLHAVAGLRDGSLCVLPYSLKSQWLQGAVWVSKLTIKCSDAPVTALNFRHRLLYAGTASGKIHAFRPVSGAEDMDTLQSVASEMERLGYGRSAEEFARSGLGDRTAGSPLREVVRLDRAFVLDCHAAAVTSLCLGGGIFFSCGADMAVVSWSKPKDDRTAQFRAIPQAGQSAPQRLSQAYSHAKVVHRAPITCMSVAGDFLLTADSDGNVCLTRAQKFREIVDTPSSTEATDEAFLEEEVLEKPKFFHQRELKDLSARHFLAHLLAHYYPMRPLSHAAKGHAIDEVQESSDEEFLDDEFVTGGFGGEDEDGDTGRVPSGDELEDDAESAETYSSASEASEGGVADGFVLEAPSEEESSDSELSSVSGSESDEEEVYEA